MLPLQEVDVEKSVSSVESVFKKVSIRLQSRMLTIVMFCVLGLR